MLFDYGKKRAWYLYIFSEIFLNKNYLRDVSLFLNFYLKKQYIISDQ